MCSRSVGRGLRAEVYVIMECSYCIYFAVDGMPIEMYGESWIADLLSRHHVVAIWLDSKRREESNGTYCAFMA